MKQLISPREQIVLKLVANEKTTKEIAAELYISNHTALSHRKNLIKKLEVRNTAGLVRRALPCNGVEYLFTEINSGQHLIQASAITGTIYGFNKISGSADVTFNANNIELSIGFQVDIGAEFTAGPGGCLED